MGSMRLWEVPEGRVKEDWAPGSEPHRACEPQRQISAKLRGFQCQPTLHLCGLEPVLESPLCNPSFIQVTPSHSTCSSRIQSSACYWGQGEHHVGTFRQDQSEQRPRSSHLFTSLSSQWVNML